MTTVSPESSLEVVFGVYDLATQRVGLPTAENAESNDGLTSAPTGPEDFDRLAASWARSALLRELLGVPTRLG